MPPLCLLYVDDSALLLRLRKATLESHGYRVEIASTSFTAIEVLKQEFGSCSFCWSTKWKTQMRRRMAHSRASA